jgi:hypothetical protein
VAKYIFNRPEHFKAQKAAPGCGQNQSTRNRGDWDALDWHFQSYKPTRLSHGRWRFNPAIAVSACMSPQYRVEDERRRHPDRALMRSKKGDGNLFASRARRNLSMMNLLTRGRYDQVNETQMPFLTMLAAPSAQ